MNGTDKIHAPRPRWGSLDVARLVEVGTLYRFATRQQARPVHTLERASLVLFGMIAGVALVGVLVMAMGGKGV